MGGPTIKKDGFTVPTVDLMNRSLASKLIPVVDRVRDVNVQLGFRPYRVRIVRTRFAGHRRGVGPESVVHQLEILPTPLVVDMSTLTEVITAVGMNEQGVIQLQKISGRYTEEQLTGVGPNGDAVAPNEAVYYEIEFFRRDGGPSELRRFQRDALPTYRASSAEWQVTLVNSLENRARGGQPEG